MNPETPVPYAARLDVDYPERLDRLTTVFRLVWAIPIVVIAKLLLSPDVELDTSDFGEDGNALRQAALYIGGAAISSGS